jgi:hypothetical protein
MGLDIRDIELHHRENGAVFWATSGYPLNTVQLDRIVTSETAPSYLIPL